MKIITCPTPDEATKTVANLIAAKLAAKPNSVLGLATGRTMEALYAELVKKYLASEIDFSAATSFNLDEYVGLDASDINSYHFYMQSKLFGKVNINPQNTKLLNGLAMDYNEECLQFENAIQAVGGIDLQLLGLGNNGHIGFNEPNSPWSSVTRRIALSSTTIEQNKALFASPELMPKYALTMGMQTILAAKQIVLLVTGTAKASILRQAIEESPTESIPASALQQHPNCTVISDKAAAAKLA